MVRQTKILLFFFLGFINLTIFGQANLRITGPLDQAKLDLTYNDEFFDLYWACDESITELEIWVDGQAYCTLCGGGTSGYQTLWSGAEYFQDRCFHILSLKALLNLTSVYSEPIIIYDTGYTSRCVECSDCQKTSAGLPVDVATGKMWAEQSDLFIDGPIPLEFVRRYNHNLRTTNGPLGYGWTHSYNVSLSIGTGAANFKDWTGRQILFAQKLDGSYRMNKIHQMSFASITGGYKITTKEGTKYNFNTSRRLTSIVDRNGNTLTLTYDGSNRLSTIADSFGRILTLTYNASNKIISVTDGARNVTYAYDGSTNLSTVTDTTSKMWTFSYDSGHRLLSITDPLSHIAEAFTYNTSTDKVLTFQQDSGNNYLSFTYPSGTQTKTTNSLGAVTTYTVAQYDDVANGISGPGCDSCGSGTNESYVRDAYFNKTQITDGNGNITKQTFDDWGNVLTRIDGYGTSLQRTTTYTYDSTFHFVTSITENSVDTVGQQRCEAFSYDSNGNLLSHSISGYSNGTPFTRTTTYTYDSRGRVLTEDGPRTDVSDVTTYTYYADDDSDLTKRGRLHTIENALGHTITIDGYTLSGKATITLDENGIERDDVYDNLDRLLSTTLKSAGPNGEDLTTTYTLNDLGLVTRVTLPNGNYYDYTYDSVNRLTTITDKSNNKTIYTYNTEGRKTREEYQDSSSNTTKFTNFSYDSYNRLQYVYFNSTVPPNSGSIYYEYSYDNAGNQKSIKDPNGHLICFEYDSLNRKTKTHQYLGTAPSACLGTCTAPQCIDLITQYGYDTQDHITSITDPNNFVTSYDVNDFGEVIQEVSVDSGTTTYTFDSSGNVTSKTDANGITEIRSYDALNRLTGLSYPDTSNNVTFSYDSTEVQNGIGKRTGISDPAGTTVFSYDKRGNIALEKRTPTGYNQFQISYTYDKNNNLTKITYPSGREVNFSYNNEDEVSGITGVVNGTNTSFASTINYAPFGQRTSLTFGNSLIDSRSYDSKYRITGWTLGSLINKTYTWQDDDNITSITDNLNSINNRTFGYDSIHRLTTANGPWGSGSYSYDSNGNRLTKIEGAINTNYSYFAGTNKLQSTSGSEPATYSYDSNGNITNDATHTYQFSQRNRLGTVDNGTTATYSYDGDGRRVKKVAGSTTTLYFYDTEGKLLEEYIPATGEGKDYLWMPKTYEPVARIDFSMTDADTGDVLRCSKSSPNVHLDWSLFSGSGNFPVKRGLIGDFTNFTTLSEQTSKTFDDPVLDNTTSYWYDIKNKSMTDNLYFYHSDHLGTPIAMTDGSGTLVWRAEHSPFGGIYALPVSTISNNLRFPGQYYDSETTLSQNWFRDYDAKIGRYREVDLFEFRGERCKEELKREWIKPYLYGNNNSMINADFKGLSVITIGCSATETALLLTAAGDAEAASQKCIPCEDRKAFKNSIRNLRIFCTSVTLYELRTRRKACADNIGQNIIEVKKTSAFDTKKCGCLQSTLLHETLHSIGYSDEGEQSTYSMEKKCFKCSGL